MLFFSVKSGDTRPASQKYGPTTVYLYRITQIFVTFASSPYSQLLPYKQQACFCTLQTSRYTDHLSWQFAVQGLSGKYPAILNISRTGRVALM